MKASNHIRLDGDVIRYRSADFGDWDLPATDVRIIGEATNQNGPFSDDYFFCFATGPEMWLEASFYSKGRDEFLRELGARLGSPLETGLCHSTDFASRVLWPPALAGQPMFRFEDMPLRGILGLIFGSLQNRQTFSEQVGAALADDV